MGEHAHVQHSSVCSSHVVHYKHAARLYVTAYEMLRV